MDPRSLAVLLVASLLVAAAAAIAEHVPGDADDDTLPDTAEMLLCSSEGFRETVVRPVSQVLGAGDCASDGDYTPSEGPTPPGRPDDVICPVQDPDNDTDGSCDDGGTYHPPEGEEPPEDSDELICANEDNSTDADGSCDEDGTYHPPQGQDPPDDLDALLCGIEDNSTDADGSCDEDGAYHPPQGQDPPDDSDALLCGIEDNSTGTDGSCDENGTYQPPQPSADPHAILCANEDPADPSDGSCEDGQYSPPNPGGADPNAVICGLENDGTDLDGHCREGTYVPPTPPEELPVGPGGLPINCSGEEDVVLFVRSLLVDFDCDGETNQDEVQAGCDPTDPASNSAAGGCDGNGLPPEPPAAAHCSGYGPTEAALLVGAILTDADCDGKVNTQDPQPLDPTQ